MAAQNNLKKLTKTVSVKRARGSSEQNFSITSESLNFSFKNKVKDLEFLENPNLFEKSNFKKMNNTELDVKDKFSEIQDPIFNLDEQLPQPILTKIEKTQNNIDKKAASVQKNIKRLSSVTKRGVSRYG